MNDKQGTVLKKSDENDISLSAGIHKSAYLELALRFNVLLAIFCCDD